MDNQLRTFQAPKHAFILQKKKKTLQTVYENGYQKLFFKNCFEKYSIKTF